MYRHPSVQYIRFRSSLRTQHVTHRPTWVALIGVFFFLPSQGSQHPVSNFQQETSYQLSEMAPVEATAYMASPSFDAPCTTDKD